jgi:hypothetical protein
LIHNKESGYEYIYGEEFTGTPPWIGDGTLMAEFDDGTVTHSDWKVFLSTHGPTQELVDAGCDENNLELCEVEQTVEPGKWYAPDYDASDWSTANIFSEEEVEWGIAPSYGLPACGKATNPFTRVKMGSSSDEFAINYNHFVPTLDHPWAYDPDQVPVQVTNLTADECLNSQDEFEGSSAAFIWADDLKLDNHILFCLDVPCNTCESCEGDEGDNDEDMSIASMKSKSPKALMAGSTSHDAIMVLLEKKQPNGVLQSND